VKLSTVLNLDGFIRKIRVPSLPLVTLHRERLIEKLNEILAPTLEIEADQSASRCKLLLLYAPAGYGKTTLLADFAQRTPLPCCWYFLDHEDTDKFAFFKYLLASIRTCFPEFGKDLLALLELAPTTETSATASRQFVEDFADVLVRAIQTEISGRFFIMLCNYHEVKENEAINHFFHSLLSKLPSQCQMVIETRAIPEFEIAELVVRRELMGLGSQMLRFTAQEIQELAVLQGMKPLSDEEAEQLAFSFDGWITGLLLGTRLGDIQFLYTNSEEQASQTVVKVDKRHLFTYVVNEVFKREPEIYQFLQKASVLQQMTVPLCNALLDITNAAGLLLQAEQQGLFVSHTGEDSQRVYSCYSILRKLLYDELQAQSPELFTTLHQRAARLLYERQNYDQALFHAIEGKQLSLAVEFIIEAHKQFFAQGYTETLARWLAMLPEQLVAAHPRLLLIQASMALLMADHERAQELTTRASAVLSNVETEKQPALKAEIVLTRGKILFLKGRYLDAQAACQQALACFSADETMFRAEAYRYLGLCANLLGDFTAGIGHFHKALQLWSSQDSGYYVAETQSVLASSYKQLGNFALAEHHVSRALAYWENGPDTWGKIHTLLRLGLLKEQQGKFSEAETCLNQALTAARGNPGSQRGEAYVLESLGGLYQKQGRYQQSLAVTEESLTLARSLKDKVLINYALCTLAMTYTFMNDTSTALFLVSEMEVSTAQEDKPGYEQMLRDLVYGTILLYQQHYEEAACELSSVQLVLKIAELRQERIQALIRLTMCHLALNRITDVLQVLMEIYSILNNQSDYRQMILGEISRLPVLMQFIQTHDQIAPLRELLSVENLDIFVPSHTPAALPPVSGTKAPVRRTEAPALKIQAFGEPAVYLDEQLITSWRRARTMELFFFLLEKSAPVRKEQIITALWPDEDESIGQTLRATIHYLRKAIGEECLITHKGTYALDLSVLYGQNVWYDVQVFQEQHTRGKEALQAGNDSLAKAAFLSMVDLYRGDFAQSFYSDWCRSQRDALRYAYLEARQHLAHILWREERFEECIIHWQQVLAVDDCLEEAHYGLMRCYLRQGKRGLALRQYQRCCEVLHEGLALRPGPTIQHLYERLTDASS
jgi:ATP/maltotriose-dependent transcriptional regulator MalT/DNA-binding SARP family transcriptional activator